MTDYQKQAQEFKVLLYGLFALPLQALTPAEAYRQMTLHAYGVVPWAIDFIVKHSTFEVDTALAYGGGWYPPLVADSTGKGRIVLRSFQDEACIHENSHVWWHWRRLEQPFLPLLLARAVVKVADMDEASNPQCAEAIRFLRGYVNGIGDWPGMYALDGKVPDVHNLTEADMVHIIDWEIFAGLCSYTMGKFREGERQLPPELWPFVDRFFTGTIWRRPY